MYQEMNRKRFNFFISGKTVMLGFLYVCENEWVCMGLLLACFIEGMGGIAELLTIRGRCS